MSQEPPAYIVCGFPRSGTSMMMRAVEAGGIPALRGPWRESELRRVSTLLPGYDPNPHGFYELDDVQKLDWKTAADKCVKVIRDNIHCLPVWNYEAVYITRDPAEIRRSMLGVMASPPGPMGFPELDDYWSKTSDDCFRLVRLGARVRTLHYPNVIADPIAAFESLGWPINVREAAATVDPALYRHRGAA